MDLDTSISQFVGGLSTAMIYFMIAAGLNIIWGLLRVMNFATGAIYLVGAYAGYEVATSFHDTTLGFYIALLVVPVAVGSAGSMIEFLLLRQTYKREPIQQFMITLALAFITIDLVRLTWGPQFRSLAYPEPFGDSWVIAGAFVPTYTLFTIALGLCVTAALFILFQRTRFGLLLRASVQDAETASALGINVNRLKTVAFGLGVALGALAGALVAPSRAITLGIDSTVLVEAFVVVAIGGMGSMQGAFIASLIVGLTRSYGIFIVPEMSEAFIYLVMFAVLAVRPWGLLGKPEARAIQ